MGLLSLCGTVWTYPILVLNLLCDTTPVWDCPHEGLFPCLTIPVALSLYILAGWLVPPSGIHKGPFLVVIWLL